MAARLGVPVKTVHTRLERGLAKLRARLDQRFNGDRGAWLRAFAPFGWTLRDALVATLTGAAMTTKLVVALVTTAVGASAVLLVSQIGDARSSPAPERAQPLPAGTSSDEPAPFENALPEGRSTAGEPVLEASLGGADAERDRSTPSDEAWVEVFVGKERTREPLVDARVQVRRADEEFASPSRAGDEGRTNARGLVRLRVTPGVPLRLDAQPSNSAEPVRPGGLFVEPVEPGEIRGLELLLEHGLEGRFHGLVVDDRTGSGLPGTCFVRRGVLARDADVLEHVARLAPEVLDGRDFIRADARGVFVACFPTWSPPVVEVHHPGYRPVQVEIARQEQSAAAPFVVRLKTDGHVTVRLFTALGVPEEYAVGFRSGGFASALVPCAPDGTAAFGALPPEVELTGEVWREGQLVWRAPEPVVLAQGEERSLQWSVGVGTRVSGVALDQVGRPVAGHEVLALPADAETVARRGLRLLEQEDRGRAVARATTDGAGRFDLGEVAVGSWWVGLAPGGDSSPEAPAPVALGLRLEPGELARRIELETARGLFVTGSLAGPGGECFEQAWIRASPLRADGSAGCMVEREGTFRVGPLLPGPYLLWVTGSGFMTNGRYEVEAGESIEVRLGRENAIGGSVRDAEGRAFEAHVQLLVPGGSLGMGTSARALGAFLFADLSPGIYSVRATTPDGRVAALGDIELEPGRARTDLDLELHQGGSLRVVFEGPPGFRCALFSDGVKLHDSSLRESVFSIVPVGDVRVEVYGKSPTGEEIRLVRHVEALPGQVQEVKFELEQ